MRLDFFLPRTPDSTALRNWALGVLVKQYGGATWITGNGQWQADNTVLREQVDWITCFTDGLKDVERLWIERSFLPRLAEQYRLESAPQTCFLFVINNDPVYWEETHGAQP